MIHLNNCSLTLEPTSISLLQKIVEPSNSSFEAELLELSGVRDNTFLSSEKKEEKKATVVLNQNQKRHDNNNMAQSVEGHGPRGLPECGKRDGAGRASLPNLGFPYADHK